VIDRPVLFYDGECRFCRASARVVASLDRKGSIAMLPFDDPSAEALLAAVPAERRGDSMHLVQPDGWVLSGGDALIELSRVLPGGEMLASAAWRSELLRNVFRSGYRFVADHRGQFSRVTPDGPGPVRRPSPVVDNSATVSA
jgi:predicted DCC family thiol-disulfide oxidoreductase YuxK